ncbi:MAG TPA: MOSC domain-containing protein [Flavobacteriales bacterium]|nr:MOSC domain-containing protein [Flavobacteriales bacterium]HMW97140.1 MOSC domain-containing protein [Flavobacteriales bacterium]HNI03640.1 MOSC domain-containing protein [Flavobacteriales bacterium]HNK67676.1 MOSC domain-containing protein [Flavobacteriales bacterium]HNK83884.1 MOSC domain-containing protein [Flavobacteriales bacterium]
MTLTVASLHIYPVKSLGGFSVAEVRTTDRGPEHDRRWMLINAQGRFISQREIPAMACLHCSPLSDGFRVTDVRDGATIDMPWALNAGQPRAASVWNDTLQLTGASEAVSAWFAHRLEVPCSLVYMPDHCLRNVDPHYATGITSLSDGYPYLIMSEASLDDLNGRMDRSIPMDRFRPNIVIAGGSAFQEDGWKEIRIGTTRFSLVKPCGRCVITTTDQRTGERGPEPLRTLAAYRKRVTSDGAVKLDIGMNAMGRIGDLIRTGDIVRA